MRQHRYPANSIVPLLEMTVESVVSGSVGLSQLESTRSLVIEIRKWKRPPIAITT
jgi:hypothetical protein